MAKLAAKGRAPRKKDVAGLAKALKETKMTKEEWKAAQKKIDNSKWQPPEYMKVSHGKGHTVYRDETYHVVCRFTEKTKIAYRPHAKAPGTKSHARYEKYAKAKTVGQALDLKCYPQDWCWDYERGYLKVSGPLRAEPIDSTTLLDDNMLSKVDRKVMGWAKKEIAKKYGLKVEELAVDKSGNESILMRAHRLVSQREAKRILAEDRAITDDDAAKVLSEWGFAKNATRQNVMQEGRQWVWSDTLGLIRDRVGDIHITPPANTYPEVMQLLNRWLLDRLPSEAAGFCWTSLNLNKDYAARIHRDGNNFGPSMISAFGDFTGGHLRYYPEDDGKVEVDKLEESRGSQAQKFDLKSGLALFNGNCAHSVEDFSGNRFSIVYFTVGCHRQMPQESRDALSKLHCQVPSTDIDPFQLIRPPVGYGKAAQYKEARKSGTSSPDKTLKLPGSRYWKNSQLKVKKTTLAAKSGKQKVSPGKAKADAKSKR